MSRLAIEFKPGVFVANINARVRDKIWKKIEKKWRVDAIMIYTTNNEQGYAVLKSKDPTRKVVNFDGIYLSSHVYKKDNTS